MEEDKDVAQIAIAIVGILGFFGFIAVIISLMIFFADKVEATMEITHCDTLEKKIIKATYNSMETKEPCKINTYREAVPVLSNISPRYINYCECKVLSTKVIK